MAEPRADEMRWDEKMQSLIVREDGDWIVSVTTMIFNDRVYLTHRDEYPHSAVAAWCYDQGGAAILAAMAWNPLTQRRPVGFKKEAFDARGPESTEEIE